MSGAAMRTTPQRGGGGSRTPDHRSALALVGRNKRRSFKRGNPYTGKDELVWANAGTYSSAAFVLCAKKPAAPAALSVASVASTPASTAAIVDTTPIAQDSEPRSPEKLAAEGEEVILMSAQLQPNQTLLHFPSGKIGGGDDRDPFRTASRVFKDLTRSLLSDAQMAALNKKFTDKFPFNAFYHEPSSSYACFVEGEFVADYPDQPRRASGAGSNSLIWLPIRELFQLDNVSSTPATEDATTGAEEDLASPKALPAKLADQTAALVSEASFEECLKALGFGSSIPSRKIGGPPTAPVPASPSVASPQPKSQSAPTTPSRHFKDDAAYSPSKSPGKPSPLGLPPDAAQNYAAAGLVLLAKSPDSPTPNPEATFDKLAPELRNYMALMCEEVRKDAKKAVKFSFPGGKIERDDNHNPLTTALREFKEETRGVLRAEEVAPIEGRLRSPAAAETEAIYLQSGRFAVYVAETPYIADLDVRFAAGRKVQDSTAKLTWVPVEDLFQRKDQPTRAFSYVVGMTTRHPAFPTALANAIKPQD